MRYTFPVNKTINNKHLYVDTHTQSNRNFYMNPPPKKNAPEYYIDHLCGSLTRYFGLFSIIF